MSVSFLVFSFLILAPFTVLAEAIPKPEPAPISGNIDWVFDYEEGQKLSQSTGKPMFVVFRCER